MGGRIEREAADGTERGYGEVVTSVADVACGYVGKPLHSDVHMWYSDVYCTGIPVPFREVRRVAFCRRC